MKVKIDPRCTLDTQDYAFSHNDYEFADMSNPTGAQYNIVTVVEAGTLEGRRFRLWDVPDGLVEILKGEINDAGEIDLEEYNWAEFYSVYGSKVWEEEDALREMMSDFGTIRDY